MMMPWRKRKLVRKITDAFGKSPEKDYYPGDMEWTRTFFDACQSNNRDRFYLDDITWNDLNLDELYKKINACQCTAGEQFLYYMLRRPMTHEAFDKQKGLIHLAEDRPDLRLKIQLLLSRVGNGNVDMTSIFYPKDTSPFWLIVYLLMGFVLFISFFAVALFGIKYIFIPIILLAANSFFHEFRRIRCEHEIRRVNYCVSLALALRRMRKWKTPELDSFFSDAYIHLDQMKPVLRSGPVMSALNSDPFQAAMMNFFFADLIAFEILKKRIARYHEHFLAVHEAVGQVDASIAIASYRKCLTAWCEPVIDFDSEQPDIFVKGIRHPLMKEPVPNDLITKKSLLITGSNASGKSTYLRSTVICVLMAQAMCTCICEKYKSSPFRIYTSIALTDDLLAGESYYIAEIKSLRRILDEQQKEGFVFCALDEVLRGTNTIERIAASAEILKALHQPRTLCLVATHDAELCALSGDTYQPVHFEETIYDSDICFDYKLKPGPAETRNAIHLLKLMGFDDAIVTSAHRRADNYVETGKWI